MSAWAALGLGSVLAVAVLESVPRAVGSLAKFRPLPRTYVGEYQNRPSQSMVVDPVTGWRMRPRLALRAAGGEGPASYETNSDGFRGPEFSAGEGRKRIVLAGDSFTFGVGVDFGETFGALVDEALPETVVYNLGMPGFALDQIWLSVRHQALPLKPALVVVTFISESFPRSLVAYRMTEGWNKPAFKLVEGRLVPKTPEDRPPGLVRFLERHSVMWRLGTVASRAVGQRWPHGESWWLNTAFLRQIRDDLETAGVPGVFVFMPTYYWPTFPAAEAFLQELGVDVINLSREPGFDSSTMYYPGDGHMNATGHAWFGEVLRRWLRQHRPEL